jgi:putative endonuclease
MAEALAACWLRLFGYRIAARRFAANGGEIDIIARRGRTVAFIEVKYRAVETDAAESITAVKRRRINSAARAWLAAHPDDAGRDCRFDAILIRPWRLPTVLRDAWRE